MQVNPPEAGLIPHRRLYHVSQVLKLGGLLRQATKFPFKQLGRLEQYMESFLLKETTTPKWHNQASTGYLSITRPMLYSLGYATSLHTNPTAAMRDTAVAAQQTSTSKGCLCTTQALEPFVGKFSWGRASNLQDDCPGLTERGREPKIPQ